MLFINKNKWTRLISGIVILTVYQLFLPHIIKLLGGEEGGIAACFGFLGVILVITFLSNLQREKDIKYYALSVGIICAVAAVLCWLLPAKYREFNATYQVVALALVSLLFLGYYALDSFVIKREIPFVSWMGKNIFLYFLILQVARIVIKELMKIISPGGITVFVMVLIDLFMIILFAFISWLLEKKKIIIKL